jgi:uncharacterized membrane protein
MSEPTGSRVFLRDTAEFGRALAFIDAIFGFSVTLLVTTLEVPPSSAWNSLAALLDSGLGDQLLAFVISFVVVAGFWRANHQSIATFRGLDSVTLRLCIYLVATIVFIPFTTEAIASPLASGRPLATALYAANVAVAVLLSALLVVAARVRGLSTDDRPMLAQISHALSVAAVFLVSIPVAYRFGADNAKWCWLSLIVLSPLVERLSQRMK